MADNSGTLKFCHIKERLLRAKSRQIKRMALAESLLPEVKSTKAIS